MDCAVLLLLRARGPSCAGVAVLTLAALGGLPGIAVSECERHEDAMRASHRRITWLDFKATSIPEVLRGSVVAYVSTSIAVEPLVFAVGEEADGLWTARPIGVCARAFLLKDRSGFVRLEVGSADLAHEQGHFDLTQIFARELGARLIRIRARATSPDAAVLGAQARADRAVLRALVDWRVAQSLYDAEIERCPRAQQRWLRWIHDRLREKPDALGPRAMLPVDATASAPSGEASAQ